MCRALFNVILFAVLATQLVSPIPVQVLTQGTGILLHDFEEQEYPLAHSNVEITREKAKFGFKSLKWYYSDITSVSFDMTIKTQNSLWKNNTKFCGVQFWIYQYKATPYSMEVTLRNVDGLTQKFLISLMFTGWRAVYRRMNMPGFKSLRTMTFTVLKDENIAKAGIHLLSRVSTFHNSSNINFMRNASKYQREFLLIDMIRKATYCGGWSYDRVNFPDKIGFKNSVLLEDFNGEYNDADFWQQTLKWSVLEGIHLRAMTQNMQPLNKTEEKALREIREIEHRIDNWYFHTDIQHGMLEVLQTRIAILFCINKTFKKIVGRKVPRDFFKVSSENGKEVFEPTLRNTQWGCIKSAASYTRKFKLTKHEWMPLFASRDIVPRTKPFTAFRKFSDVTYTLLLPVALRKFIINRAKHLKGGTSGWASLEGKISKRQQYKRNTGSLKRLLRKIAGAGDGKVIKRMISYLHEQGFSDGSGVGLLDHFMNLNKAFYHSIYLLRKYLKERKLLRQQIATSRWYTEMGEIYQEKFNHKGTTADRAKTILLGRLLTIVASPQDTLSEARQKVSDALFFKRWADNALTVSEGLGGLFKPDYVGYHHKGPYLVPYVSNAVLVASTVSYFLHNTSLQLSQSSLYGLKQALKNYYIISNDYALPTSVSGRFQSYTKPTLSILTPAYAYLAMSLANNSGHYDREMASIFLKLYRPSDPVFRHWLLQTQKTHSEVLHTVGSLVILEKFHQEARSQNISQVGNIDGHWYFSFAALGVHRRGNWTISVKGFSKYIWDFESGFAQNVMGRYQSHGALLIAGGRKTLQSMNLFRGYDWNKIPGTTTLELTLDQLVTTSRRNRNFQNSTFVGGVYSSSLLGAGNGFFAMDFKQPFYTDKYFKKERLSFEFKKTYLFVDDLIICLGSGIKSNSSNSRVITTLFQNMINGHYQTYTELYQKTNMSSTILVDPNNNGYFVPTQYTVEFAVGKNKISASSSGQTCKKASKYATAVISSGIAPKNSNYEYAVLVNGGLAAIEKLAHAQQSMKTKRYKVIQKDHVAHVVRVFKESNARITAYSIFDADKFIYNKGPVHKASHPCLILVTTDRSIISVSISDPDLRLFKKYRAQSKGIKMKSLFQGKSLSQPITITLNYKHVKLVNFTSKDDVIAQSVVITTAKNRKKVINVILSKGFTVEINFRSKTL